MSVVQDDDGQIVYSSNEIMLKKGAIKCECGSDEFMYIRSKIYCTKCSKELRDEDG